MKDAINYGQLMQSAFRKLIVDVLGQVEENGLPGDHHFFITFDTRHKGVDMSASLSECYPEEMTIVMQDWYENLKVLPDRFEVTLNFGEVPEPIVVPFDAVRTFVDPSVEFGLKFDTPEDDDDTEEEEDVSEHEADIVSLDQFRKH